MKEKNTENQQRSGGAFCTDSLRNWQTKSLTIWLFLLKH